MSETGVRSYSSKWSIEKIRENVWYVNESGLNAMYLVKGSIRSAVIDTGTGTGDFRSLIESILGTSYVVILTHGHMDHAGGMGQFEKVYIHEKDMEVAKKISLEDRQDYILRMEKAGALQKGAVTIDTHMKNGKKTKMLPVKEGDIIDLGNKKLVIFEFPGHTNGSVCILDAADRILFSGDSMNEVQLISAETEDRMALLEQWYQTGKRILGMQAQYDLCAGGHRLIPIEDAEKIVECGRLALNGTLTPEKIKVHFFNAPFYSYKDVVLYNGEFKDLY